MTKTLAAAVVMLCMGLDAAALEARPLTRAAEDGRHEAQRDIREGKLILRSYGLMAGGTSPYTRLLFERLGVRTRAVAGCVVDATIIEKTSAYNEVMKEEISRRFGAEALEEIASLAAAR